MIYNTTPTDDAAIARVEAALSFLADGGIVVVVDDFDRENEGDFLMVAQLATPEAINFMATEGRGLICQTITRARAEHLGLEPQARANTALHGTAFTVSVDAIEGVTSGISAADRAHTIRLVTDPATRPTDLARPGHVFPLIAADGGVLERRGHTESGCDLAELAGYRPSAVICEIMDTDGTMACGERLAAIARRHALPMVSVDDIVVYRLAAQIPESTPDHITQTQLAEERR